MELKNKVYIYVIGIISWISFIIVITNFICNIKSSERNEEILYELQEIEISNSEKKNEVLECFLMNLDNLDNCKKIQDEYKEQLEKHSERVEELRKKFEN